MEDVYQHLARRLDRLPHGYPATDSGVELRILERIFTPEDAEMALRLTALPEPASSIARRLGRDPDEIRVVLDGMAERGQIGSMMFRGERCYCVIPFIVGIYEFQLPRLDRELAELFEEYAPTLLGTLGGSPPALARVIPVNLSLESRPQVLPHEDLRQLVDRSRSFRVMECICRKEKGLLESPCSHPAETCLAMSSQEEAFEEFPTWGRSISRQEALEVLAAAEQDGLVHCTYNVQIEPMFVCNCCSCCCGFLRSINEFQAPHVLVRANVEAVVDADACLECGQVADDEVCPMDAIGADAGRCTIDRDRCIGCGVCVLGCPGDAMALAARPDSEQKTPPRHVVDWYLKRTDQRSGRLRGLATRGWLGWEMMRRSLRG